MTLYGKNISENRHILDKHINVYQYLRYSLFIMITNNTVTY